MQTIPIIQCQQLIPGGLGFDYPGTALDIDVQKGEFISIIGHNYTGKAHWLKAICGLEEPLTGRVIINGVDSMNLSEQEWVNTRIKIAYLHADTALLSAANGLINTLIPSLYHQIDKKLKKELLVERALDILEEIDPAINLDDLPAYISKEHRYKIAIARVLLLQPDLLALNNPFTHFNQDTRKQFEIFLQDQVKKGLSLMMVIHDVSYAVNNSDRIIFTEKDNLYLFNSKQELLNCDIPAIDNFIQKNT